MTLFFFRLKPHSFHFSSQVMFSSSLGWKESVICLPDYKKQKGFFPVFCLIGSFLNDPCLCAHVKVELSTFSMCSRKFCLFIKKWEAQFTTTLLQKVSTGWGSANVVAAPPTQLAGGKVKWSCWTWLEAALTDTWGCALPQGCCTGLDMCHFHPGLSGKH